MSRWDAVSDYDYLGADCDDREFGPCETCEGLAFCLGCDADRAHCICQPKIQDLQGDDDE